MKRIKKKIPKYSKEKYGLEDLIDSEPILVFPLKKINHKILVSLGMNGMLLKGKDGYYLKTPQTSKIIELLGYMTKKKKR